MKIKIIDSHAHLTDEIFNETRDEIIANFEHNNIEFIINPSCDKKSSLDALALSKNNELVYAAVGFHPENAIAFKEENEKEMLKWLDFKKVLAVGEIGLDFYYDKSTSFEQKSVFDRQIQIAYQAKKPIIIHMRDATKECLEILKYNKEKIVGGVVHCFTGKTEVAKELLNLGLSISFAGPLTYKNANLIRETALYVPLDNILLETDSPYLSPVPFRGKTNEPKNIWETANILAEIKEKSLEEIASVTNCNTKKVFFKQQ